MKVSIYKKKVNRRYIYVMTPERSLYAKLHAKFRFRTIDLPKPVIAAIRSSSPKQQMKIAKTLYKGI